jgi:D-beta-D-heptose 7-phosphate kinase/D-beta-D-heptose 1-phosphate adenosyltransferase
VQAIVISDYAKGVLTPRVISEVIALARAAGRPVVADPKGVDFTRYRGVTVLKPNARELSAAMGLPVGTDEEAEAAGEAAMRLAGAEALLVTRSERGMSLMRMGAPALHFPGRAREVFDVSGAGDTALAALALGLAVGAALPDAAQLANVAAGIAVGKVGTALVYPGDVVTALHSHQLESAEAKILPLSAAEEMVQRWRVRGLRIGFTNGCFDLIHPGHVSLLAQARAACDRLVVGLNADSSVKRLKGEGRPVNTETARAVVLGSLASVDAVVLFEEDTPLRLIETLRPDVLVKGADYALADVVGADIVQSYGGAVMLAELRPGHSTTGTIAKLAHAQKAS